MTGYFKTILSKTIRLWLWQREEDVFIPGEAGKGLRAGTWQSHSGTGLWDKDKELRRPSRANRMGNLVCVLKPHFYVPHMLSCSVSVLAVWLAALALCLSLSVKQGLRGCGFPVLLLLKCLDYVNLFLARCSEYCSNRNSNTSGRVGGKGRQHRCVLALLSAKLAAPFQCQQSCKAEFLFPSGSGHCCAC